MDNLININTTSNHNSLTPSSNTKKSNQLQRLVRYTENQKSKKSFRSYINNDGSIGKQMSNCQLEGLSASVNCKSNEISHYLDKLTTYHEQIISLKKHLTEIKNNIAMQSKELLIMEQERLKEDLVNEEKTQEELLRHQSALSKHNEFLKDKYDLIKPKDNIPFL